MYMDWLLVATIPEMQEAMAESRLTSESLTLWYLQRIAKWNGSLNAVLEINPDALGLAMALDMERNEHGVRGPMHGIPVLLKDNIDTHDGMHTSAGSLALANSFAKEDAFLVQQLRKAGAVLLGKVNMTEWANWMSDHMPSGYSSRGGQVLNPYGPGKFDVGGSSAGSGSSIAAHFAAVAVGTETSGSILSPSSQNSLVGLKPTVGLVSRRGVIPISHSQDTAGPMARTVTDCAVLLNALVGHDPLDPITMTSPEPRENYLRFLREGGLKGARIGVARDPFMEKLSDGRKDLMERAIQDLKRAGAVIVDPVEIPYAKEEWLPHVLTYEFKSGVNNYLKNVRENVPIHSVRELIDFNYQNATSCLRYGQIHLLQAEETSGTLTEKEYLESRLRDLQRSRTEGIDKVMKEHTLTALLFPGNVGASIPAKAGYPSITVPGGYDAEGQPLGITFTGLAYSEPTLLSLAYDFEQKTRYRKDPVLVE